MARQNYIPLKSCQVLVRFAYGTAEPNMDAPHLLELCDGGEDAAAIGGAAGRQQAGDRPRVQDVAVQLDLHAASGRCRV